VENSTIIITFHPDTLELDLDAPQLSLDTVISFLQRALRQCENAEKIVVAQQVTAAVRDLNTKVAMSEAVNEARTKGVLSRLKIQ
jgi:transposase-like protein